MRTGTDLSGELLDGRFRVESTAGRGRFGTVFHGRDQTRGVACAVRVLGVPPPLPAAGASAAESLRGALRECVLRGHKLGQKTGAMVKTFGFAVPPVPANAASAGIAYVASAWLDGESLAESLDRRRIEGLTGRSAAEVLAALGPVAEAIAILHDLGGVHGALHPHAIRLVTLGRVQEARLLDAGLETVLLGANGGASRGPWHAETDAYLAPEQLSPSLGDPSPRTDVYSLALLVLELLADKPPIPLAGERETREQVLDPLGRPTPGVLSIDVEPVVADVLARAVSLEPLARFRDANTFWTTLKAAVERAVQMPRPSRLSVARANDTIQMSGGSLPSVRSLDALLEAVAVEPPPRESEDESSREWGGRAEWRSSTGDDSGNDELREGSFSEEEIPQAEESDEDEPGNDLAPRTPSTSRIPVGTLAALPAGPIPAAPPSLSVAPPRWSGAARNGSVQGEQRSHLSLFVGLGAGAALGVALFAYLLGGPSAASPTLPVVDAAPPAASAAMAAPFDGKLAAGVLAAVDARIPNCRSAVGPTGKGTVHLTFAADGTVSNVTIDPPYAGTSRGVCVAGLFRTPRVPPFSGSADPLAHTFSF
jgi:serine/threonine protein kinase